MNFDDAVRLLDEQAPGRPAFVQHSHVVADVAGRIGRALVAAGEPLDLEPLRVQALLHDFGRSRTHGSYHGWVGYALLRRRGLAELGRGCVTHWLRGLAFDEALALGRLRPRFLRRVYDELELPHLSLGDLVVSVADFSAAHTKVVTLEERERDLVVRYGDSRWLRRNAEVAREHRDRIERACGRPLRELLPEISAPAAAPSPR